MLCLYCAVVGRDAVGGNYTLIAVEAQPAKFGFMLSRKSGKHGEFVGSRYAGELSTVDFDEVFRER